MNRPCELTRMTIKNANTRRLVTIALSLVSVAAVGRLIIEMAGGATPVSTSASSTPASLAAPAGEAPRRASDLAAKSLRVDDSVGTLLQLGLLERLDSRALPDFTRNPFEYGPTPEEIKKMEEIKNQPPPPPPPPIPYKAIGYQQDANGKKRAYLDDGQDSSGVYMVREGEQFGQRFKVLKITDSFVEVQDETYHQIVQLPYPAQQ